MMDPRWKVRFGAGELLRGSDAGVFSISVSFVSLANDTASLSVHPDLDLAYGSTVEIYFDDARIFLGRVQVSRLTRNGQDTRREIPLWGPWAWLTRIGFRQTWMLWRADALGASPASRVILNQAADGTALTVEAQLEEVIAYAHTRGAPLLFGGAEVNLTLPFDEQRDLTCEQAIHRGLRFTPGVCSWIDYAAATPTIYFGQGNSVSAPSALESDDTMVRDDLVCPGLTIEIERLNTSNGTQYRTLEVQQAGDVNELEAMYCTLSLAGAEYNATILRVDVETEAIPAPLTDAQYWIDRHSRLQGVAVADLSFIQATRYLADGKTMVTPAEEITYPRRSLTPIAQLASLNVLSRMELWRATVDIIKRDAAGAITDQEHAVELEFPVVVTNAITKTYQCTQSVDGVEAEPCPSDLAAKLLAHWSVLYAQGTADWPIVEGIPFPGALYGDYASPVQSASIESGQNSVAITFGPPRHLEVADFASRLQGFRTRRAAFSYARRTTGQPDGNQLDGTTKAPASGTGHAPGVKRRTQVTANDGRAINLNPADIDAGKSIGVQTLTITKNGVTLADVQVLATGDLTADLQDQTADSTDGSGSSDSSCLWCPRRWDGGVTAGGDSDGSVAADSGGVGDTAHPGSSSISGVGATDVLHPARCPPCLYPK